MDNDQVARELLSQEGFNNYKDRGWVKTIDTFNNLYDEKDNPDGIASLASAENRLMHKELTEFINAHFSLTQRDLTYSDGAFRDKALCRVLAGFLTTRLRALQPIDPRNVVCLPGVTTVTDTSAGMLANPGEGLLLGRPFYTSFPNDVQHRTGVKTVTVAFEKVDPFSVEAVAKYEETLLRSEKEGVKVRGLILCSPHNPLGRCFARATLIALMKLCQKHRIHLLSDEIYALSVWKNPDAPDATPFTSVLGVETEGIIDKNLLHVFWGISKDFGAAGARFACIVSQNQPFLEVLRNDSLYTYPSSIVESVVATLLSNASFLDSYISENSTRLSAAYVQASSFLREHGIPYARGSNAGFFLWVELRSSFLRNRGKTEEEIKKLSNEEGKCVDVEVERSLEDCKVQLGRGDAYGAEEGGWYRIIFTYPWPLVQEGLRRTVRALK